MTGCIEIDANWAFEPGIELGRSRAVRLVDRHLCQPAQQLGAAVGRRMGGQQIRTLLDEGGRDVACDEVGILQNRLEEREYWC